MKIFSVLYQNSLVKKLFPIISFISIVIMVFEKLLFVSTENLISFGDIHRSHYFFFSYLRWALSHGFIPWWNPYTFGGMPFLANPSVNPFYPINWLLIIFPLAQGFLFHLSFHIFWAMTGMYFFLKRFFGTYPAWFAAVAFGLSGVFSAHLFEGNYDVIAACSWLGWTLFAFSTAITKNTKKSIVIAGMTLTLHILAGYQTMTFFAMIVLAIYTFFSSLLSVSIRPIKITILGTVIALGLSAIQIIPMQELVSHTIRTYPKPYEWISYGSFPIKSLAMLIYPFIYGDQYGYNIESVGYWEHALFIGKTTLFFAAISLPFLFIFLLFPKKLAMTKKQLIITLTACFAGIFGLWVSLGVYAPIDLQYILWKYVPIYGYIRIPPRHLLLVVFSIASLAAMGLHILLKIIPNTFKFVIIFVCFLLLAELIPYAKHFVVWQDLPEKRHDPYLISTVTNTSTRLLPNFVVWYPPRRSIEFDSPLLYRYFSVSGYDVVILKKYYQFFNAISNRDDFFDASMQVVLFDVYSQAISFLNIGYILTSLDNNAFENNTQFTLIKEDMAQFYRLYKNENPLPRFSIVPSATIFKNENEVYQAIRGKKFDYTKTFATSQKIVSGKPSETCTEKNPIVTTQSYEPNKIILTVEKTCDNFIVSSENNYPGWKATIDGKDAPIITANLAFRALYVPKGKHTITFFYSPTIFVVGFCVSLATSLAIVYALKKPTHHEYTSQ